MASSGMLRRVALVRTDVSEEFSPSIIRVTSIGELGTLAVTSNRRTLRRNLLFKNTKLNRVCPWDLLTRPLTDYASRVSAVWPNIFHINPPSGLLSLLKHFNAFSLDNRVGRTVPRGSALKPTLSVRYALNSSRSGEKGRRQTLLCDWRVS
jgi:hypothetical protein